MSIMIKYGLSSLFMFKVMQDTRGNRECKRPKTKIFDTGVSQGYSAPQTRVLCATEQGSLHDRAGYSARQTGVVCTTEQGSLHDRPG